MWFLMLCLLSTTALLFFTPAVARAGTSAGNSLSPLYSDLTSPQLVGTEKTTTTATLSLKIDLTAVSAQDALGELSIYAGGGQSIDEAAKCQDYRDFSFAKPTALGSGFEDRGLTGQVDWRRAMYTDLTDAHSHGDLPVWASSAGLLICGLKADTPITISLFAPDGSKVYTDEGLPAPIRDDAPTTCSYPTSGLPQDFCYWVDEPKTVDFLPWELAGGYRVEVNQGAFSFAQEFNVHLHSDPAIYYSQRANGYVLAGFAPHEQVRIVQYEGIAPVAVAPLTLDEYGSGLLVGPQLGISMTVGAIREDLSAVATGDHVPTVDLDALIERDPGNVRAYYARAQQQESDFTGGWLPALRDLNTAILLDPGFAPAYELRAKIIDGLGDSSKTIADYSKAIELDPAAISAYLERAAVYVREGELELALHDLSAALDLEPEDTISILWTRAGIYEQTGNLDLAISDYYQITTDDPSQVHALFSAARLYREQGNDDYAIAAYKEAIERGYELGEIWWSSDEEMAYVNELAPEWIMGHFVTALRLDQEDAVNALDEVIAMAPDFIPAYRERARKLSYFDLDRAIPAYARLLELDPTNRSDYFQKAILEEATGDYATAIRDYGASYPYSPQAQQLTAQLAEKDGDYLGAIGAYSELIQSLPLFMPAYYHRGRLYEAIGDDDSALTDYTAIIEQVPLYAETALYARAQLYSRNGEEHLARIDMLQALALDEKSPELQGTMQDYDLAVDLLPDSAVAHYLRSQAMQELEADDELQLAELTAAVHLEPNYVPAHKAIIRIFMARTESDNAIAASTDLIRALEQTTGDSNHSDILDALQLRASLYDEQKRAEEAISDYTSAINIGASLPYSYDSSFLLSQLFQHRATLLEGLASYAEAIADYTQLIATETDNRRYYYLKLARLYEASGELEMAGDLFIKAIESANGPPYDFELRDFDRLVRVAPEYAPAHFYRGQFIYDQGGYEEAILELTTALELGVDDYSPLKTLAYRLRANAFYYQGDYERAVEDYTAEFALIQDLEASLGIDLSGAKNVVEIFNLRARAHFAVEDYAQSISDLTEAIDIAPTRASLYSNRGFVYYQVGEFEKAIFDYSTAIDLEPDAADSYRSRGTVYVAMGNVDKAIADYETFVTMTDDPDAKEEVEDILADLEH